jgi:hypothetical protein
MGPIGVSVTLIGNSVRKYLELITGCMEVKERRQDREEASLPSDLTDLREGDILYDRHRRDCYQVDSVEQTGVGLHQDGTDFHIPHSLFVSWYGQRLFSIEQAQSIETPDWCDSQSDPEEEPISPAESSRDRRTVIEE